jgi:orotate phosphoribosyltransferase
MESTDTEVLEIFTRTGALLKGHFVLRSGLHSGHFFQCAKVGENLTEITRLAEMLVGKLGGVSFDTVLAPAMGGLVMGQEVARQTGSRFIFAEKVDNRLVLRRGFKLRPGEKILIVEDVVTRGGRVKECIDIITASPAECVGIAMLVDRSGGQITFEVPMRSLLELTFPAYPQDQLPPELAAVPVEKPGS